MNPTIRYAIVSGLSALFLAGCGTVVTGSSNVAQRVFPADSKPALAVDPSDGSLLRASGGLFRSRDQGQSWQPVELPRGLPADRISLVATAASGSSVIYAGGPGAGIRRSTDGGQSWIPTSEGLPSQDVRSLAVHTFRPDTVYALVAGEGVFRTEDAGARWQKMDDGPEAPLISLAHSRLEGSMNTGWLYAGTPEGTYLSMDCF